MIAPGKTAAIKVGIGVALTVLAILYTAGSDGYQSYIIGLIALTCIVGVGLNVLMGLAGQISLGQIGFYAIGAYAVGIAATKLDISFWLGLLLGTAASGAIGCLLALPAVRLKGPYLAMMTIAFAFVVEHGLVEWKSLTGGANGMAGLPPVDLPGGPASGETLAAITVGLAGLSLLLFGLLRASGLGFALRAMSDSENAAASVGINPTAMKTAAFGIAAAFAGFAGGFFAPLAGFINPESFPLLTSIIFVLVVMAGGRGTMLGPLVGAIIVIVVPETLAGLADYRLLFVGFLLLIILLMFPTGVVGVVSGWIARPRAPEPPRSDDRVIEFAASETLGPTLTLEGLSLAFGGVRAAEDVSFSVQPTKVTSLIGPNGAGKTTVLNMISGFYRADRGEIRLGDQVVSGRAQHRIARLGVARSFQTTDLFDGLSVVENLIVAARRGRVGSPLAPLNSGQAGTSARREAMRLLAFTGFDGDINGRAGDLPHVDRRIVEIARCLALKPRVLLLDEPAAGLSAEDTERVATLVRKVADAGVAVLVVEHDMELVMSISDEIVVLDAGKVIAEGPPAAIRANPRVQEAYLGEGEITGLGRETSWAGDRDSLLNVGKLTAGYGAAPVLNDVGFTVHTGEMVAVLGANGAGKSTLMHTLAGLMHPSGGSVEFLARNVGTLDAAKTARMGLVLVPEGRQVFPELSVVDNILLGAFGRGTRPSAEEVETMLDRFPKLRGRARQRAGLLSGGEQQMLAIARGLMARPKLLLLDEPSLGLAPVVIDQLYADLAALRDEGMTILLVDQMAALALSVVDRGLVIANGRIAAAGSAAELRDGDILSSAYLGGEAVKTDDAA